MENREAIKIINQYDMNFHWNDGEPIPAEQLAEAFDLAIAALEKQIPKRKLEKDQYNENLFTLRCPTCETLIGNYNKRSKSYSYSVYENIVTSADKRLILANHRRKVMDNKETINWLTRIRDRLMTTISKQYEALTIAISALEKQEADKWIPCSEKMPAEPFGCFVTVMDTNPITQEEFENILPYFVGWDGEQWNDADGEQIPCEVLAWLPLPKPYKLEEES